MIHLIPRYTHKILELLKALSATILFLAFIGIATYTTVREVTQRTTEAVIANTVEEQVKEYKQKMRTYIRSEVQIAFNMGHISGWKKHEKYLEGKLKYAKLSKQTGE